ncbi:hypothetical protein QA995_14955 [Streptomyces scabiei]|uniref:hypothetical protein n=1 Tax=Streptomyces scabiei TaxID=1930 RepID=UPI000765AE7D|nr:MULTISPECIES: hypothetical protein [Streptomyces]QTU45608.1 hypothetical protein F3K20_12700 [Streptomyces sp. LBUM 1482]
MSFYVALIAAAALMVGGSAILLRPEPTRGQHRRRPALLACPMDALDKVAALCTTEGRVTLHTRVRITKQFICLDCHQPSPDPASYEAQEGAK